MNFLKDYDYKELKDGAIKLELSPVEEKDIYFFVKIKNKLIIIYDGGSTFSSLNTLYNFSSKEFISKLVEIAKNYKISKKDDILFLECKEEEFKNRLKDFITALNKICNI